MKHFSPFRIHSSPLALGAQPQAGLGIVVGRQAVVGAGVRLGDALAEHERVVREERLEEALLLLVGAGCRDQVAPFPVLAEGLGDRAVALASSAITSACVTKSVPWPPHSFGTASVRKPSFEPFLMMSQSQVSRGSAICVALERDRADLLVGELARLHLPGALLVAQ